MLKGFKGPQTLFNRIEAQRGRALNRGEIGRYLVTFVDNHDSFWQPTGRFAKGATDNQVIGAIGFLLCSLGTPCIYYGTEQGFSGQGDDNAMREAMFDKAPGGKSLLNTECRIYKEIAKIAEIMRSHEAASIWPYILPSDFRQWRAIRFPLRFQVHTRFFAHALPQGSPRCLQCFGQGPRRSHHCRRYAAPRAIANEVPPREVRHYPRANGAVGCPLRQTRSRSAPVRDRRLTREERQWQNELNSRFQQSFARRIVAYASFEPNV